MKAFNRFYQVVSNGSSLRKFFSLLIVIVCPDQRWAIIRKKRLGNWNMGGNTNGVQLTEAQRAARHAMNLALDLPVKNTFANNSGNCLLCLSEEQSVL